MQEVLIFGAGLIVGAFIVIIGVAIGTTLESRDKDIK
jgi:hypothetical protein